ncbi:hypothetical protein QBC35DRAFT_83001 [Podospora australis]|uniref:Uncharacterized protein n=1 Tax=Podospora australis TaxID=1536484 RepID=A0AAN6WKR8_9PEZI|nr:hypothetical protein QBC35DRAFT_83001 [Podospora australis]
MMVSSFILYCQSYSLLISFLATAALFWSSPCAMTVLCHRVTPTDRPSGRPPSSPVGKPPRSVPWQRTPWTVRQLFLLFGQNFGNGTGGFSLFGGGTAALGNGAL